MRDNDLGAKPVRPAAGRAPAGDDGVTSWVNEHWGSVYGLLYRLTRSRHDAEDMAQETFLKAVSKQAAFEPGTNRRAWLLRIATNLFFDQCRRKKVVKTSPLNGSSNDHPAGSRFEPSREMEGGELNAAITAALATLAETPRAVFLLRTEQGLEFSEIAGIIGTSEATVRWHLMQARRQLMIRLEGKL